MKKRILLLFLAAALAQPAAAWRPRGWVYSDWPWAYDQGSGDWYWFFPEDAQWVHGFPPAPGWSLLSESELASGWSWYGWPYAHGSDEPAWFYINEADKQACANMRTAEWSLFGEPPVLEAWPAGHETSAPPIRDAELINPGVLVLPPYDVAAGPVSSSHIRLNGLPWMQGHTRWLHFSNPSAVTYQWSGMTHPQVPLAADVEIIGDATSAIEIALSPNGTWPAGTTVDVEYRVVDGSDQIVAIKQIRLIGQVVVAIGDSLTYGFRRRYDGTHEMPLWGKPWTAYPSAGDWGNEHWNDIAYQGPRGYLRRDLTTKVAWAGHPANGHGPDHCGYPGASTGHIIGMLADTGRSDPAAAVSQSPTFTVIVYFIGLNDIIDSHSANTLYADWKTGLNALLARRAGRGRTLVVGVTLPKMRSDYTLYSAENQAQLIGFNARVRTHTISAPYTHYVVADVENVPHDSNDDGLHFLATGYWRIATIIRQALVAGVKGMP